LPFGRETTDTLAVPLTGLDGREFGVITLVDKRRGAFSELDEAVLVQLAQMASAAAERTRLYLRTAS
jgi:GAF domain-containing protein